MKLVLFLSAAFFIYQDSAFRYPINANHVTLTEIGEFGIERVARPGIPAHLHTGIDILPPDKNYSSNEPIFPIARGVVISKRTDGPYAQLIIEHDQNDNIFWSVYEHIADIEVELFQPVEIHTPLARFFKTNELDRIGWQFNHFHLEILKKRPLKIERDEDNPERLFNSYSLNCYTKEVLNNHFHNPLQFLASKISN